LANTGVTVTTGAGLSGGGLVNLGASLTLVNEGVRAAVAGTGVAVSSATGNVTFSIGQAVAPASSVTFNSVTSNTTIAATANITGGNLITGGRLVATNGVSTADGITAAGNVTGSYIFGNGSQLTGLNAFRTVVANGTNLLAGSTSGTLVVTSGTNMVITANSITDTMTVAVANAPTFSGNVTGGNLLTGGLISATGNITGGNLSGTSIVGTLTTAAQTNITSVGTLGSLSVTGNVLAGNLNSNAAVTGVTVTATGNITGGNIATLGRTTTANLTVTGISTLGSNANVKISGGAAGQTLTTDGTSNLYWSTPQAGNTIIQTNANTTINVDFSTNSLHLLYLPTGPVTVNLSNYTTGVQSRVIIRFGTAYTVDTGVGNVQQTTEGLTTIPTSGGGGHKIGGNQSVQLLYTCYDSTAGNCYVASTFL
jgi:hypothetical protein